jgi:hypothetical protein
MYVNPSRSIDSAISVPGESAAVAAGGNNRHQMEYGQYLTLNNKFSIIN